MTGEWIHRLTWSDGRVTETAPRPEQSKGTLCLAAISQMLIRRRDPGATVVHLVLGEDGRWEPPVPE